jgi:hypothetical protein
VLSDGSLSDMANMSWAKNAVLEAAIRELEWEICQKPAITPQKPQQNAGVFEQPSPLTHHQTLRKSRCLKRPSNASPAERLFRISLLVMMTATISVRGAVERVTPNRAHSSSVQTTHL